MKIIRQTPQIIELREKSLYRVLSTRITLLLSILIALYTTYAGFSNVSFLELNCNTDSTSSCGVVYSNFLGGKTKTTFLPNNIIEKVHRVNGVEQQIILILKEGYEIRFPSCNGFQCAHDTKVDLEKISRFLSDSNNNPLRIRKRADKSKLYQIIVWAVSSLILLGFSLLSRHSIYCLLDKDSNKITVIYRSLLRDFREEEAFSNLANFRYKALVRGDIALRPHYTALVLKSGKKIPLHLSADVSQTVQAIRRML